MNISSGVTGIDLPYNYANAFSFVLHGIINVLIDATALIALLNWWSNKAKLSFLVKSENVHTDTKIDVPIKFIT